MSAAEPFAIAPEGDILEALRAPAHIGRITLNVRDAAAVGAFYRDVLGLELSPVPGGATLSTAGGARLIDLISGAGPARPDAPGLFHTAFLMPSRRDLARWVTHARSLGTRIEGASDHLVSEAIYLSDPEGNGIEVYADRPRARWPMDGEKVKMATLPLDGASLLAEADGGAPWLFPEAGRIGHVHLQVSELAAAEAFYGGQLGMTVMARYPGATFLGWGGYHHHLAVNVWRSKGAAPRPAGAAGLAQIDIVRTGDAPWQGEGPWRDPSGAVIAAG